MEQLCQEILETENEMRFSRDKYLHPPTDPMNMTVPDFLSLIYGRKALVTLSAPKTLVLQNHEDGSKKALKL